MPIDKPDLASLLDVLERAWDKWMQDDQQVAFDGPVVVALQDLIIALRAARQPQPTPKPPCPECRDRPGHIDIRGGEVPCKTCGRTYTPPAPQRFWRVARGRGESFKAVVLDDGGYYHGESLSPDDNRPTREQAVADGIASGLPAWHA